MATRSVFLSSTGKDLTAYRDAVYRAVEGLDGHHCVGGCTYFVPVLSPHFHASSWTQFEDNLAWQREVEDGRAVIVPVLLGGDTRRLPLRYRQRRFVDLRADFEAGIRQLVAFFRQPAALPAARINPIDGSELVLIPAGIFQAGSDEEEDSNPARELDLPAFYLARNPVNERAISQVRRHKPEGRQAGVLERRALQPARAAGGDDQLA